MHHPLPLHGEAAIFCMTRSHLTSGVAVNAILVVDEIDDGAAVVVVNDHFFLSRWICSEVRTNESLERKSRRENLGTLYEYKFNKLLFFSTGRRFRETCATIRAYRLSIRVQKGSLFYARRRLASRAIDTFRRSKVGKGRLCYTRWRTERHDRTRRDISRALR